MWRRCADRSVSCRRTRSPIAQIPWVAGPSDAGRLNAGALRHERPLDCREMAAGAKDAGIGPMVASPAHESPCQPQQLPPLATQRILPPERGPGRPTLRADNPGADIEVACHHALRYGACAGGRRAHPGPAWTAAQSTHRPNPSLGFAAAEFKPKRAASRDCYPSRRFSARRFEGRPVLSAAKRARTSSGQVVTRRAPRSTQR